MTYSLKIEDFIDLRENKSSFEVNDLIRICKRHNNPKRDYLFVNQYQAKHQPAQAHKVLDLFSQLYREIQLAMGSKRRILIVGFAETATAIAQSIMQQAIDDGNLNAVFYLQTTRESIATDMQNLAFEEEHSHATTQKLYYRQDIPNYDTVLFIEDEITTGNTILNFIEAFKAIQSHTSFAVASILNWQNEHIEELYRQHNIESIYLIKGRIKARTPAIHLEEVSINRAPLEIGKNFVLPTELNPRTGLTAQEFQDYSQAALAVFKQKKLDQADHEKIAVIGTEENMWLPIRLAQLLKADVRATTRSPIAISRQEGYLIQNGISLPSAYEEGRLTFLYNIETVYDQIIIVYEVLTDKCRAALLQQLQPYSRKEILFIPQA